MKVKVFFRWYDLWIGTYVDKKNRTIYICPIPMFGIKIIYKVRRDKVTRYEKMSQIDNLAEIIYDTDFDNDRTCAESPLRVNDECPVDEDDICKETCVECIKAWLEQEEELVNSEV